MQHFPENSDPKNISKVIGQKRRSRSSSIDPGHARKESTYWNLTSTHFTYLSFESNLIIIYSQSKLRTNQREISLSRYRR